MQQHSGEHIFSGIVHGLFGYENIGFHLGDDTITLDFSGPLTWDDVKRVETKANEIIWRNEEIEISFPSSEELKQLAYRSKKELEGKVRIVTIPEADVCACCGTHVHHTGEIGLIKAISLAGRKSGSRVEILCGRRAFNFLQAVNDENLKISHLLSAKLLETSIAVERLQQEMLRNASLARRMALARLEEKLPDIPEASPLALVVTEAVDAQEARRFANEIIEVRHAEVAAVFIQRDEQYQYVIISHTRNLRELSVLLNQTFSGRGGGSAEMIQGSLSASEEAVRSLLESWAK